MPTQGRQGVQTIAHQCNTRGLKPQVEHGQETNKGAVAEALTKDLERHQQQKEMGAKMKDRLGIKIRKLLEL